MKVIHSSTVWLPQTQTWLYELVHGLQIRGIESHVVCEKTSNLDQFHVENIHCLRNQGLLRFMYDKGMRRVGLRNHLGFLSAEIQRNRGSILHSHFGHVGWGDLAAARASGVPHVTTFYGFDLGRLPKEKPAWRKRYLELFEYCNMFIVEGPFMGNSLEALGCPKKKIRVHHLGVSTERIGFSHLRWNESEPFRVLIAATFTEKKGIPYAIEALGMLSREVPIAVTVIGDAGPSPDQQQEKARIMEAIRRAPDPKVFRLLGYQPHRSLFTEAQSHHVLCAPSVTASTGDTEGGAPVAIIEMAAAGVPIVATKHCDIPNVIEDEVSGLLVEERDSFQILGALRQLLSVPSKMELLATNARKRVEEEFNLRTQVDRLSDFYEEIST